MKLCKWRELGVLSVALAASTTLVQSNYSAALAETPRSESGYHLAQGADSCRQVIARNGLYVRQAPTVYSRAIGVIQYGRNVTIQPGGDQYWVPISAPLPGYVWANWLTPCDSAYQSPQNCRLVRASERVPIREAPSAESTILGTVAGGRRVTIENRGANGWVPISVPLEGYISSAYLSYCAG